MTELILIVAASENNVIGKEGKIPWTYPEDMKRFKYLTTGNAVIMGRKTYNSIGKPLPKRTNIVLTSDQKFSPLGVIVCRSLEAAINHGNYYDKTYIIGGQKVYEQTIDLAQRIELTRIHKQIEGDTFFPQIDKNKWEEILTENRGEYSFMTFVRKK